MPTLRWIKEVDLPERAGVLTRCGHRPFVALLFGSLVRLKLRGARFHLFCTRRRHDTFAVALLMASYSNLASALSRTTRRRSAATRTLAPS